MGVTGIIPSRLKSNRLPEKALIDIDGLPMIVHVFKRAQMAKSLDRVMVATDSQQIFDVVTAHGGEAVMTSEAHETGSDRIAEVAGSIDSDIVVNIQGDEPLLDPEHIDEVVKPLQEEDDLNVAVLVTPYSEKNRASDIKAVLDLKNNILYCSRTDLPSSARTEVNVMWKMSFIVPFRRKFLLEYTQMEQTPLELLEYNEYLRILENGYKIRAVPVNNAVISVDTREDLDIVRSLMKTDLIRRAY